MLPYHMFQKFKYLYGNLTYSPRKFKRKLNRLALLNQDKMEEIRKNIEEIVTRKDPVEILSHISLLSQYIPVDKPDSNQEMREQPYLHFLSALALKKKTVSNIHPANEEVGSIFELLEEYFSLYGQNSVIGDNDATEVHHEDLVILSARLQNLVSQINVSMYDFQLNRVIDGLFSKFDDFFLERNGFTPKDALTFAEKIIKRYVKLVNNRLEKAKVEKDNLKDDLRDPDKRKKILEDVGDDSLKDKDILDRYFGYHVFTNTKEIFVFDKSEIIEQEDIDDAELFNNYLDYMSCQFGEGFSDFALPLDDNIIFSKPIINLGNNKYFVPIPLDLTVRLPSILESVFNEDKANNSSRWQTYQQKKSKFVEDIVFDCFSKLFPAEGIHRNLHYEVNGIKGEVDLLIIYDTKIFIIESKSGLFTSKSKLGNIDRIKTDLIKLVEDAFEQGKKLRDLIKSESSIIFCNKKGEKIFEFNFDPIHHKFFIINTTLEPLMSLVTNLKDLRSLGMFSEKEYPWSVNIFELDIITQIIDSPSVFIHYIEKRLDAQDINIFHSSDELSYFGYYLDNGNFYIPFSDSEKKPNFIAIQGYIDMFDLHYVHGAPIPTLRSDQKWLDIIKLLEISKPEGYTDIASVLLDFALPAREKITETIELTIAQTKKDKRMHDFTMLFDTIDTGFTFFSSISRNELAQKLQPYCELKKYEFKTTRWIGLGTDINDDFFINVFVYSDSPWKEDSNLDKILKMKPFKHSK